MHSSKRSLPLLRESHESSSIVRCKENVGEKFGSKNKRVVVKDRSRTRRIEFKKKIETCEGIAGLKMQKLDRIG